MSSLSFTEGRHRLDPDRPKHRESLVWVVPEPAAGLTTFVYTWVNSQGIAGAALAVFGDDLAEQVFEKVDGIAVPDDMGLDAWQVGPLSLSLGPDGMRSTVRFAGRRVAIDLEHTGFHRPFVYGDDPRGCPGFFADDRIEQSGRSTGTLRVDDRELAFDAPVQRDHSWGERDWAAMHHMKWVNALTPDGRAVHAVELLAFGQRYLRGYVLLDGELSPLTDLTLHYDLDPDLLHTGLTGTFRDERGRACEVEMAEGGPHFVWDVDPRLTLRDTAVRSSVDGAAGVGYVDMSWHPDYLRHNATGRTAATRIES